MLTVNINKNSADQNMVMNGSVHEITNDVCMVINGVYTGLYGDNPNVAKAFRAVLTAAITAPDSSIWELNEDATSISLRKPE